MAARFDFDEVFGDDYLHFASDLIPEERSDQDAELIARLLDLRPGMRVLDVPCGFGRVAASSPGRRPGGSPRTAT